MLHRGFLHRDIGIPTVFLLPNPVEMTPFVPGNFEHALGGVFLTKFQPGFKDLYPLIFGLVKSWRTVKDGVDTDDVSRYYIRHAVVFAHRVVADYLRIVHKHREWLR